MESNTMMLVVLILSFVALGASVVGLAIPYWLYISYNGAKEYAGLWVDCVKVHIASNCFSLDSVATDALRATQAMELIGMLLVCLALILAILKLTVMKHQPKLPTLSGLLMIIAGVCMIVGTIIYATKVREQFDPNKNHHLYAGFGLCAGGGVLAIIAGICFLVIGRRAGSYSTI